MKVPTTISKRARFGAVTLAAIAALAGTSQASHWSQQGGNTVRSGFQVSDPAGLPLPFRNRPAITNVLTSPVISAGTTLTDQRVAYGFLASGAAGGSRLGIHNFATGTLITNVALDDLSPREPPATGGTDSDAWGTAGGVTPVIASDHGSPGVIYAVYNDDNASYDGDPNAGGNDISIAQVDAADGTPVYDQSIGFDVPGLGDTDGWTIDSPPALSEDVGDGRRMLAFTMRNADSTDRRIVQLTLDDAANPDVNHVQPAAGTLTSDYAPDISENIAGLNTVAGVTYVRMLEPLAGHVLMIAVPTSDGIKTFRSATITDPGPSITGIGPAQTISAPARTDGSPAGNTRTPFLYVATGTETTTVYKLQQPNTPLDEAQLSTFTVIGKSPELAGAPGRGIAVAQSIPTTGPSTNVPQPGRVLVGTSKNVFSLETDDLDAPDPPQVFNGDKETGFTKTIPAASGELGFIADDKGAQFVFYTEPQDAVSGQTLRVLPDETGFTVAEPVLDATASVGQPAVSRGRVVFGASNGLYTYGPNVAITSPSNNGVVRTNTVALSAYAFNPAMSAVDFYVDEVFVGADNVNDDRNFTVNWDSLTVLDGVHTVRAVANDGTEENFESSAPRRFIVNNWRPPIAALTVSPKPANPGSPVTLDASASTATANEPGLDGTGTEQIVRWSFELDGDNDYDDAVETAAGGGDGRITQTFEPGNHPVGVRVTDSHGDVDQKTDTLRVNVAPAANLVVGPNPAAEGQEVTLDASTSTDVDGSIVTYEFDLDGNGTFEHSNGANPKVQRVFAPGTTRLGARVTDNEGAASVVTADLVVNAKPQNQVPVASFVVAPNPAKTDQRVLFDARGARDPDGLVARYEWDLDDNGTFETDSKNNPRVQRSYRTAKVYNVKLRVTDNLGAVSTVFTGSLTVTRSKRPLPRRLTAKVTPMRDATVPYTFRTTGKLTRPRGITAKAGCNGRVTVTVKAAKRTISRRTTRLRSNCTYRTRVRFRDRSRMGRSNALRFTARFQGNKALRARQATTVRVRLG